MQPVNLDQSTSPHMCERARHPLDRVSRNGCCVSAGQYRVGMISLLLLNPLTGPICPLEPTCDSCISALAPLHGVRTCENTGRGELGSVIGQCENVPERVGRSPFSETPLTGPSGHLKPVRHMDNDLSPILRHGKAQACPFVRPGRNGFA